MWIGHRKEIRKWTFRALAFRPPKFTPTKQTKSYRSKNQLPKLFTVANSQVINQVDNWNQIIL